MPKYSVLMTNGDVLGYAQWFHDVRSGQYSRARIGRQYAAASKYMWQPSPFQEAEYGTFSDCEWANTTPGFSGTGYVIFDSAPDSSLLLPVAVERPGSYQITFRYSLEQPLATPVELRVGTSQPVALSFPPTGPADWATNSATVVLSTGTNSLRVRPIGKTRLALDYCDIKKAPVAQAGSATATAPAVVSKPPGSRTPKSRQPAFGALSE
jgi:hypothetical protein